MGKHETFYEFKNNANSLDIWIYGQIISGTDKWSDDEVTYMDFKNKLDSLGHIRTINMYINSPGGSVFTTQGIVAMLQRVKEKGVTINAWIDGLGASCASFLPLIAHNVYTYNSSLIMVHHPMTIAMGNINDLQKEIDILNKIEDSVMMPIYMSKAREGITEGYIKTLINKESWLNAKEMCEVFDIKLIEDSKDIVASLDTSDFDILSKYDNTPESIKSLFEDKKNESSVTTLPQDSQKDKSVNDSDSDNNKKQKMKIQLGLM